MSTRRKESHQSRYTRQTSDVRGEGGLPSVRTAKTQISLCISTHCLCKDGLYIYAGWSDYLYTICSFLMPLFHSFGFSCTYDAEWKIASIPITFYTFCSHWPHTWHLRESPLSKLKDAYIYAGVWDTPMPHGRTNLDDFCSQTRMSAAARGFVLIMKTFFSVVILLQKSESLHFTIQTARQFEVLKYLWKYLTI